MAQGTSRKPVKTGRYFLISLKINAMPRPNTKATGSEYTVKRTELQMLLTKVRLPKSLA